MTDMQDQAMAVAGVGALAVPERRSNAITGPILDRLQAFEQMAAHLASLQLNGWDDVPKCKAACWLADAGGVHPATFIQNHYCMRLPAQGGGTKLVVEPRVEFVLGVLQSRVAGFIFKVLEETDQVCEVEMSDGRNVHRVRYTLEDAKRQGLMGRGGNMWTSGNTREGCYKQAVKRCGRRIGPAALMDLPVGIDGVDMPEGAGEGAPPQKSSAEVLHDDVDAAVAAIYDNQGQAPAANGEPKAAPAAPAAADPHKQLSAMLKRVYGKNINKAVALQKATIIYNQMMLESTGVDPKKSFSRGDEIGPLEAAQMVVWHEKKYGTGPMPAAPLTKEPQPGPETHPAANPEAIAAGHEGDDGPPEDDEAPPDEAGGSASDAFLALSITVERARRLFGRKFITEHPPESRKWWYTDQQTYSKAGFTGSVKVKSEDEVVLDVARIDQLNRILTEQCDERERGGR